MAAADRIIDLSPGGNGTVVAEGTPEHVATIDSSCTGHYLRNVLAG